MTNGIQLLRSSSLFSGAPYAYAAQAPPGSRFVFLAGACPLDFEGTTVGRGKLCRASASGIGQYGARAGRGRRIDH